MWNSLFQGKATFRLNDLWNTYTNVDPSLNILLNTFDNLKSSNSQMTDQSKARLPNCFFPLDHSNLGPSDKMIN